MRKTEQEVLTPGPWTARLTDGVLLDTFACAALRTIGHPTLLAKITQAADVPKAIAEAAYRIADAMMAERLLRSTQDASNPNVAGVGSTGHENGR